ncbi:MAG: alanine--glyoxylate aminotransferase family protein [Nitrospinota bacterium]
MRKKKYLLAPGPTPVIEEALLEMAMPILHHRTPQFSAIIEEAKEGLKYLFQTKGDVLILCASGTGAMEGSVSNLFSPGDNVIVINGGKFSERWVDICGAYGLNVQEINVEWGKAVDPSIVRDTLKKNKGIKGVFVQASETSTTVAHPVKELAEIVRDMADTILVVDGISGVGVFDIPMDKWGIDVLVSGSQKALMLPPGLSFVALSDKAWQFTEDAKLPRYYFDFRKERDKLRDNTTAYTPAISLIVGLRKVLQNIMEEGLETIFARHESLATAARAAILALGLRPLAPDSPSNCATGFFVPDGIDGGKFARFLRDELGITIAGGQGHLKGKILRVAHMGYVDMFDIIVAISGLEMALKRFGYNIEFGRGVKAAQKILYKEVSKVN